MIKETKTPDVPTPVILSKPATALCAYHFPGASEYYPMYVEALTLEAATEHYLRYRTKLHPTPQSTVAPKEEAKTDVQ